MPSLFLSGVAWKRGAGRQLSPGRGVGGPHNYGKNECFKEKIIKQGQMEICTEKLFCVGFLNLGLRKK